MAFDYLLLKNNDSSLPPRIISMNEIVQVHVISQRQMEITLKSGELIGLEGIAAQAAYSTLKNLPVARAGGQTNALTQNRSLESTGRH